MNNMNFAKIGFKKHIVLHSMVLYAVLSAACPESVKAAGSSMVQPLRQESGHAASTGSGHAASTGSGQAASTGSGHALPVLDVYKSPQCGCCKSWAEHLQKNGFTVILHDAGDVPAVRKKLGMPELFGSCHTARAGQYLVEGHVPAADIRRLLEEHPRAIGLAVPSMPPGSPGMEGERSIPYDTLLVGVDGNASVFAHH